MGIVRRRVRSRRFSRAFDVVLALGAATWSCDHNLPATVSGDVSTYAPILQTHGEVLAQFKACTDFIDGKLTAARSDYTWSDSLILSGGIAGATSGSVAGIEAAAGSHDVASEATFAGLAAVGAGAAALSKLVPDPKSALDTRNQAVLHYEAALGALNGLEYATGDARPYLEFALGELQACHLNPAAVPGTFSPPGDGGSGAPPSHPDGGAPSDGAAERHVDAGWTHGGHPIAVGMTRDRLVGSGERTTANAPPALSPEACVTACRQLCVRKRGMPSGVVGHFCSSTGAGFKACIEGACNDPAFLRQ